MLHKAVTSESCTDGMLYKQPGMSAVCVTGAMHVLVDVLAVHEPPLLVFSQTLHHGNLRGLILLKNGADCTRSQIDTIPPKRRLALRQQEAHLVVRPVDLGFAGWRCRVLRISSLLVCIVQLGCQVLAQEELQRSQHDVGRRVPCGCGYHVHCACIPPYLPSPEFGADRKAPFHRGFVMALQMLNKLG